MNKINYLYCIIFTLFLLGCSTKIDYNALFDKMVENPILEEDLDLSILYSYDLNEGTKNEYQDKIYKLGKSANEFLLEKAKSLKETKYVIPNIVGPMKEGDIAISLILDINQISESDFIKNLVVNEIKKEFKENGSWIWWEWINKNIDNRSFIIEQLKKIINA